MVDSLKHHVAELIKWGTDDIDLFDSNEFLVERELVQLYKLYFDVPSLLQESLEIGDVPKLNYGNIRIKVTFNFPRFGFYPVFLPLSNPDVYHPSWETKDALDDLASLIYELYEVHWLFEQHRSMEAVALFKEKFEKGLRTEIINLLNYLRNQQPESKEAAIVA